MSLASGVARYTALKRAMGISFVHPERQLMQFAAAAEERGERFVDTASALGWIAASTSSPRERRRLLNLVRGLAVHLHAEDQRHEIPGRDAFGRDGCRRPPPHILSTPEICRIMAAALELPPVGSITPTTFHFLLGLIAATGLRRSEAVALRIDDISADGLLVRGENAKSGRERLVPLHASVRAALQRYLDIRTRLPGSADALFILHTGRPVSPGYLSKIFVLLAQRTGLREPSRPGGPRLHDLRHSYATRVLECGQANGGAYRLMMALSSALGHTRLSDTYWYLEATPVLLDRISDAAEQRHVKEAGP